LLTSPSQPSSSESSGGSSLPLPVPPDCKRCGRWLILALALIAAGVTIVTKDQTLISSALQWSFGILSGEAGVNLLQGMRPGAKP